MKLRSVFLALPLLVTLSCKTDEPSKSSVQEAVEPEVTVTRQPQAVFDLWNQHISEETTGKAIQADCKPTHFGPPDGTPSKGLVVLYHGFTACPQQFFATAKLLTAEGFDVFLPLMPGQGRMPLPEKDRKGVAKDDFSDLPKDLDVTPLKRQAETMNKLAAAGTGLKIVGGLSGGGGLATGTAVEGKGIWDRAIFMAPFYKFPITTGPLTAFMDQIYPGFSTQYDAICKQSRGISGKRNGLCGVTVSAMRTMLQYGLEYRARVNELTIPVQYVGVEKDPTISSKEVVEASKDVKNVAICFFYKGVPHSMMSRLENSQTDHAWVDSLEKHLVAFVTTGKFFSENGVSSEGKAPLCQVDKKPTPKS